MLAVPVVEIDEAVNAPVLAVPVVDIDVVVNAPVLAVPVVVIDAALNEFLTCKLPEAFKRINSVALTDGPDLPPLYHTKLSFMFIWVLNWPVDTLKPIMLVDPPSNIHIFSPNAVCDILIGCVVVNVLFTVVGPLILIVSVVESPKITFPLAVNVWSNVAAPLTRIISVDASPRVTFPLAVNV